ncbi:bifunctional helix-turn-helix transcriptional regulator/GNAT family N-acetyltransferase [Tunturiibacter gelidoferens]|uniref:DNA-binding MarR family transcriptional regulator/GNAT superfamily N-acetyltransferase n=1 Tax=Tunturiibacter gelidiferens TaxID=3069689 RepID=A0A9X0QCT8_9BACT|nr:helix-turn-helix domain-containing GNAT family N-acetyltransferase [Edaphobacter lichenicola]MBB5328001.1 DNA-binding MarR family transcriptional regulator/GNAT superfamily N-acetyltransferase [Edaphobacter lichenicola]
MPQLTTTAEPYTIVKSQIAAVRAFNRFYTRIIGTLREGLLNSEYSLSEARVLYELANRPESTAREIARDLELDAGYLSRILRKFESGGLLGRKASVEDGRQSILKLTRQGKAVFSELDQRSNDEAEQLLRSLSAKQLVEFLHGMRSIENALEAKPSRAPYILRQHRAGDMGWVVHRHGVIYTQELGWTPDFEAVVARIVADFIDNFDPKRERCWIAERDGEIVGSIFLVKHPEEKDTAKLRLLLVEASARGLGLGKTLVDECTHFGRAAGYKKITLWTHDVLAAARHIYSQAGYKLVEEEPRHSFGVDVISETWDLTL